MTFREQVLKIIKEHEKEYNPVDDYVTTNELAWLYEEIRSLNDNPWHIGTPTEEGWYLCFVAFRKEKEPYPMAYKWEKERGFLVTDDWVATEPILMWQKIELPDKAKSLEQKITPFEADKKN